MAVVDDRLRGQGREVGERGVHLRAGAFEKAAAAGDEERVAREDAARVGGAGGGRHVVADGVLRVARGGETSVYVEEGVQKDTHAGGQYSVVSCVGEMWAGRTWAGEEGEEGHGGGCGCM